MKKHHGFDLVEEKSGKTKIYADENIDSNLISYLKDHHRINIITVEELGFKGRDDDFQFKQAFRLDRFLLTCDYDFLDHKKFPFNQMKGVIILDIPNNFPGGIGYIQILLTTEIFPSGKELNGTKVIVHKDSVDIIFVNEVGKIEKQSFDFTWRKK